MGTPIVLRRKDGLAVQKEAMVEPKRPEKRIPLAVSRHCQHIPTDKDLSFLVLDASHCSHPQHPAVPKYEGEAARFVEWYRKEEGKEPAPELVQSVILQIQAKTQ